MKFSVMSKQAIFIFIFMLVSSVATILVPVHAHNNCDFPAIFNFGDSNSDTGGFSAAFFHIPSPYGDTYFHMPAGRSCDGRLIIDFIGIKFLSSAVSAEELGLPFIDSYLDSLRTNFSHGTNFASALSTIRLPDSIYPSNGGFSPFYLDLQYSQFVQFINRSKNIREQGGLLASLLPKEEYFAQAIYNFDIGQNDLAQGFSANLPIDEVNASVPDIVNKFSANIKNIYSLGARSFWVHNTGPIGCLPFLLTTFASAEKDSSGCLKAYNEVAQYFNLKLKEAVAQLRNEYPSASVIYVDIYSVKYSLFAEPEKHGFELPLVACCGYGGEYNFSPEASCGSTITVNGTNLYVGSCERPSVRVIWDGGHYTDAANKYIFDQISTGAFSDPPVPLKRACHRT